MGGRPLFVTEVHGFTHKDCDIKNGIYLSDFLVFRTACDQKNKMGIYNFTWTPKLVFKILQLN